MATLLSWPGCCVAADRLLLRAARRPLRPVAPQRLQLRPCQARGCSWMLPLLWRLTHSLLPLQPRLLVVDHGLLLSLHHRLLLL